MKRDMELIRAILLKAEEHESGFAPRNLAIEGYSSDVVSYHCHLIGQAGLATVLDTTHMHSTSPEARISKLTWQGHEFLDAARDQTTWDKAKETLAGAGKDLSGVTIGVLQGLLTSIVAKSLGL